MTRPRQFASVDPHTRFPQVHDNRRGLPRYAFTAAADVMDLKSEAHLNSRISDLGAEGCYVDSTSPFPTGTEVKIRISHSSKTFESRALVVYSLANMGMGLSFVNPDPEQLWVLQGWIDGLNGKVPSESAPALPRDSARTDAFSIETQRAVLRELLATLIHKGTLTSSEGAPLLQRLLD